jgi:hypothetical protein
MRYKRKKSNNKLILSNKLKLSSNIDKPNQLNMNKLKYSLFQVISILVLSLTLLFSILLFVCVYFLTVPDMRFSFSTILNDPSNFFDFTQFPEIKFSTKVTLVVYNPNYIPIPFVSSIKVN